MYQDVLCRRDYVEHVVASFHTKLNQNTMVVIYRCLLRALYCNILVQHTNKHPHNLLTVAHIMMCFNRFYLITAKICSYNRCTQKKIIELLNLFLVAGLSTVWENKDSCANNYRCVTTLYLLSILLQLFNIIIYHGISASGNDIDIVYGLNCTEKRFISHLMATVQLPGSERFDTKMVVQMATKNYDISLALELEKTLV